MTNTKTANKAKANTTEKAAPKAPAAAKTAAAPKAPAAPKTKAPAKKAAAKEAKASVYVQFCGKEFSDKELVESAKNAYVALGNKASDIKTIEVYVKPEEHVAYYAVNGEGSDEYKIQL